MDKRLIIGAARGWMRTPFHHQQAVRGVGCDCIGLLRGVMIECGLLPADFAGLPDVASYRGYPREPDGRLMGALDRFLTPRPIEDAEPGDCVVIQWSRDPRHVGILADHPGGGLSLIHTLSTVCEHGIDERWQRRIIAAYDLTRPRGFGAGDE